MSNGNRHEQAVPLSGPVLDHLDRSHYSRARGIEVQNEQSLCSGSRLRRLAGGEVGRWQVHQWEEWGGKVQREDGLGMEYMGHL